MGNAVAYEDDLHAWAMEQAALLRAGRLSEADVANIAEEIKSLGRSERRELVNRLSVLLLHLLKWQFQPVLRSRSWQNSIAEQRRRLQQHLRESPSLRDRMDAEIETAFVYARLGASSETGMDISRFPTDCPWTAVELLDDDFLPP